MDRLSKSDEASIRWKIRVQVLGEDPQARSILRLREEIRRSPRVRRLLDGHAALQPAVYAKWQGGHWVLQALAELGYPPGDAELAPIQDRVLKNWLAPRYFQEYDPASSPSSQARSAVPVVAGRYRRCGSQQGGALLAAVRLGLTDDRTDQLAERLLHWQWPDGGWNCDTNPEAQWSSVYETLLSMRALAAYAAAASSPAKSRAAAQGATRAAEVLLTRRILFRRSTGRLIRGDWAKLHYPVYWHYDVLAALKGIAEAGLIHDPRCADGLDLVQRKELPTGGWPAEACYYRGSDQFRSAFDHVDWGGAEAGRLNEWVTADALAVLAAAGRR